MTPLSVWSEFKGMGIELDWIWRDGFSTSRKLLLRLLVVDQTLVKDETHILIETRLGAFAWAALCHQKGERICHPGALLLWECTPCKDTNEAMLLGLAGLFLLHQLMLNQILYSSKNDSSFLCDNDRFSKAFPKIFVWEIRTNKHQHYCYLFSSIFPLKPWKAGGLKHPDLGYSRWIQTLCLYIHIYEETIFSQCKDYA